MIKKQLLTKIIVSTVSSILLGLLLILLPILLPVSKLIRIAFIVLGVITVINYIPSLIAGIRNISTSDGVGDLLGAIFGIAIGGGIRIAISAISEAECRRIPAKIAEAIRTVNH